MLILMVPFKHQQTEISTRYTTVHRHENENMFLVEEIKKNIQIIKFFSTSSDIPFVRLTRARVRPGSFFSTKNTKSVQKYVYR